MLFLTLFELFISDELHFDVHFPSEDEGLNGFEVVFEFIKNAPIVICKFLVVSIFVNEFI